MLSTILALAALPVCETPEILADELQTLLAERYVIEEVGRAAADAIDPEWISDAVREPEFGRALTFHLRDVTGDLHFGFQVVDPDAGPEAEDWEAEWRAEAPSVNYGLQRAEILDGNIGYLRITTFYHVDMAGEAYRAAFRFLSNSDALIIDVRGNGGGDGSTVDAVRRFVLGRDDYVRLRFVDREGADHSADWYGEFEPLDLPVRFGDDKPVYVLIDGDSFSAAEDLAYALQNDGRAAIVGEPSGGGANPPESFDLPCGVRAWVPTKQPIDPRTGTNWERVGVQPDIDGGADALAVAADAARQALGRTAR